MISDIFQKAKNILTSFSKIATLVVALLVAISITRSVVRIISAQKQVEDARQELAEEVKKQQSLERQLADMQGLQFKEKEARDKLGLAKPNEVVIIMPDEDVLRRLSPRVQKGEPEELPSPNWERWLKLFFDN